MGSAQRASRIALSLVASTCALGLSPSAAVALNPLKPICGAAGLVSGIAGKACHALQHVPKLASAGKKLITGHPRAALRALGGTDSSGVSASTAVGLAAIVTWVLGGAKFALHLTATAIAKTTSPRLGGTWFSSVYWRMAAVAAVLTLPFLFAAAIQALIASDLALLARATLGYLPLALLAVSVAAPVTMLLLAASDELSGIVSAAAGNPSGHFLGRAWGFAGGLSIVSRTPFIVFVVGLFTVASAIVLWLELAVREAAVYVVVLMLPLAFAALAWPARRVWAVRAVELLVALILSKFAIVAVLTLGGAALDQASSGSVTASVAGAALVAMGAFAPWAMLRLVPLSELASGAAGALRPGARATLGPLLHGTDAAANAWTTWAEGTARGPREEEPSDPIPDEAHSAASAHAERPPESVGALVAGSAGTRASGSSQTGAEGSAEPEAAGSTGGRAGAGSAGGPDAAGADGLPAAGPAGGRPAAVPPLDPGTPPGDGQAPVGADFSSDPAERVRGMAPMWQADDDSSTLTFGTGEWPPPRRPREGQDQAEQGTGAGDGGAGTADDADPRPPSQPPPGAGL
ncbi:MAG: hypothetical protein ACR2OB_05490 [Solirubrobacteraceae bacterium]